MYFSRRPYQFLFGIVVALSATIACAQNGKISGFEDAKSVAGSKKLDTMTQSGEQTINWFYNLLIAGATLGGVVLVLWSFFQFWKASKEERESPKSAIVAFFVGAAMTAVGVIAVFTANTLTG